MKLLKNAWYVAAYTSEIENNPMVPVTVLGEPVVLYRKADGSPVALEDRCVHRLAPLSLGRVEGDNLRCMYHGVLFSEKGRVLEIPGQDLIPARACVRSYPVVERSGWVWVWPGDPARADVNLIPPVLGMRNPEWILHEGRLDYACSADLINVNLLDLGHLAWVHQTSFGANEKWATTIPVVTSIDRGVRVQRWVRSIPPIPKLGPAQDHELVDHWATFDFFAPGIFHFYNAMFPLGAADRHEGKPPSKDDPELIFEHYTQQAVLPMTDRTTRYFFTWGPSHRCGGDADMGKFMGEINHAAFQEDKVMIEGQQKIVELDPSRSILQIVHDRPAALYDRTVQKLLQEETAESTVTA